MTQCLEVSGGTAQQQFNPRQIDRAGCYLSQQTNVIVWVLFDPKSLEA